MAVKRTQRDLSQAIGAAERTVNRTLFGWKALHAIDRNHARYIVHDRALLEGCAAQLRGSLVHPPLRRPAPPPTRPSARV
jgi:hypothetical protein